MNYVLMATDSGEGQVQGWNHVCEGSKRGCDVEYIVMRQFLIRKHFDIYLASYLGNMWTNMWIHGVCMHMLSLLFSDSNR